MTKQLQSREEMFMQVPWAAQPLTQQDISDAGNAAVSKAMELCCQKLRVEQATLADRLAERDAPAWACFGDELIRQAAAQLGAMHEGLAAAYIDEYDASPEDLCFGEAARIGPPLLILHASEKTPVLDGLVRDLDTALVQGCHEQIGRPVVRHVLDVQTVTDAEIINRTGYGALITSIHFPPLRIWSRS